MSDRWAVGLALATAAGAVAAGPLSLWLGVALAAVALAARRPALLCLAAAALASALAARSWAGLVPPPPGPVSGVATLVTDPVNVDGAVRAELRLGGRRFEAWARGRPASRLGDRLAGERLAVRGRLEAITGRRGAYLARRHVVARLIVTEVGEWSAGTPLARVANDLRRVLLRGAASLGDRDRALFAGFVLGDDRDQDVGTIEDFRAAGLSHLLAVSGQNVAFVLALAAPALRWLGLRGRFVATLGLLVGFGVLARWEPSVLRAAAMAAVTVLAATLGRPASTLRVLALAITGVLLVDPLLVGSVGFLLSCGACAGIAVLTGPFSRRLPLPVAVTLAAQVGVAPVLVPVFGTLPVASLPANLLAVPAAGPVMVWGLAAGLPAGLVGGPAAAVAHWPTGLLVKWVAGVARWTAALPLGQLRAGHLLVMTAAAVVAAVLPRARPAALAVAITAGLAPMVTGPAPAWDAPLTDGARLWHDGRASVVVLERPAPGPLLAALRERGVRGLDVVALVGRANREGPPLALAPVLDRHPARLVLSRPDVVEGTVVTVGRLRVEVVAVRPALEARVRRR